MISQTFLGNAKVAEIYDGIEKSPEKKERRNKIEGIYSQLEFYPFDELSARKYSIIRTQLEKDGLVISARDLQISSIAKANKLIVVTHSVKEFKRIEKLDLADWAEAG